MALVSDFQAEGWEDVVPFHSRCSQMALLDQKDLFPL